MYFLAWKIIFSPPFVCSVTAHLTPLLIFILQYRFPLWLDSVYYREAYSGHVFSYKVRYIVGFWLVEKLRYIVGFWLVEMAISTNQKPTIYRNLYEDTDPGIYLMYLKRSQRGRLQKFIYAIENIFNF